MSRAKPKPGAGNSNDLIDYKIALRSIDINPDAMDPLNSYWCLKAHQYGNIDGRSLAGSLSGMTSVKSLQQMANGQN